MSAKSESHGDLPALVLAAGLSRRAGPDNKLLWDVNGVPMVRRVTGVAAEAGLGPVGVIVGHEAGRVRAALADLAVETVDNLEYAEGMASSLRAGIAWVQSVRPAARGVMIMLADMPGLRAEHVRAIADTARSSAADAIVAPVYDGRRGHPVWWPQSDFASLAALTGDRGAQRLLKSAGARLVTVAAVDDGVLVDVDTAYDLAAIELAPGSDS